MTKRKLPAILEILFGVLFLIAGFYTISQPNTAVEGFVIVYGIVALVTGIADIILFFSFQRRVGFAPVLSLLGGILDIILGLLLLFNVDLGAMVFTIIFPIWFIVHCIVRLASAGLIYGGGGLYWLSIVLNILGILLGILLILNPVASFMSIAMLISFYLIVIGISSIITGIASLM